MTHTYLVAGITCEGCVTIVKALLEKVPGVTGVEIGLDGVAAVTMSRHLNTTELQAALRNHSRYQLAERDATPPTPTRPISSEPVASRWVTYRPILLVFGYILGTTVAVELAIGTFDGMRWMRHFMAGFFLVFSFFKMLDVPAFAVSYSSYDLVARRWLGWGYVYPFVELTLGVLFLLDFQPIVTNALTLVVMGVSTVGVVQSLLQKRRFQCACLGAVFNLPMSNVTLMEDLLMVVMSGGMLYLTVA